MPKKEKGKFQSWNPRAMRWICFENGMICGSSEDKFPGVRVEKGKVRSGGSGGKKTREKSRSTRQSRTRNNPFWLIK